MNERACEAVVDLWTRTVKARALCPYTDSSGVGLTGYLSPGWYRQRGAVYFVNLATPLSLQDIVELNQIGQLINRSFVISMAALLESYGVVAYRKEPDRTRPGGAHTQLTKWLRNRFAHGDWAFDPSDPKHVETRSLLQDLFPAEAAKESGFPVPIDGILESLKDGVLEYIRSAEEIQAGNGPTQPLAYTTSRMSWPFLMSALRGVRSAGGTLDPIDLNLETPACVVLCCTALEAFINEVSSLTSAFVFEEKGERPGAKTISAEEQEILNDVAAIRDHPKGSSYDRYKIVVSALKISKLERLEDMLSLQRLRDALVHFRECHVPIIEDSAGVIRHGQGLPEPVAQLKRREHNGRRIVAEDEGVEWTLRVSTNAMAAWSVNLVIDAIMHVLDHLPTGRYRDFIWKAYASRDSSFGTVFDKGRSDLVACWSGLSSRGARNAGAPEDSAT